MSGIDTAFNYRGFTSHRALASIAKDLLAWFTVSTKVGFFPAAGAHPVHSLTPARLRAAVEQSCDELGRAPDTVFMHSPERSLAGLPPGQGRDMLTAACETLAAATSAGLCSTWGIATWDPRPIVQAFDGDPSGIAPEVLMLRAGLAVADPVLRAGDELCRVLNVPPERRWGMSPFGGNASEEAWRTANLAPFLTAGQDASTPQVAFRVAYELPPVVRVAVGTTSAAHLTELVAATELALDGEAVGRYRTLIRSPS